MTASPDRKTLRTIAHSLHPVVTVAEKGLNENVNQEIERALSQHELIKIKVIAADRTARSQLIDEICVKNAATLVQRIGNIAVLHRAAEKPDPRLSNILRSQSE